MSKPTVNIAKNVSGLRRIPRATYCSMQGFKAAWIYESGFRQYAVISCLLAPLSLYVGQSSTQTLLLVGSLMFLLFAELINSSIEAIADVVSPEYNELIGRAKDLGSAGVFTALVFAGLVWGVAVFQFFS